MALSDLSARVPLYMRLILWIVNLVLGYKSGLASSLDPATATADALLRKRRRRFYVWKWQLKAV